MKKKKKCDSTYSIQKGFTTALPYNNSKEMANNEIPSDRMLLNKSWHNVM